MSRTILIMAGGTGGHVFSFGRASRLTVAARPLACAENEAERPEEASS